MLVDVAITWYLVFGIVLMLTAVSTSWFGKWPITTSIFYFLFGVLLGPYGLHIVNIDLFNNASAFERMTEVVVLVSLFVAGLKLRLPFSHGHWKSAVRLAFTSMSLTVLMIAALAHYFLKMPLGAAIILGAILAPTDPVLASAVQVTDPHDRDRLRFSLTGEAGLNDGTAFPFIMLGLGILGLHDIGAMGFRWLAVDVVWAVGAGLGIGWVFGTQVSNLVVFLRRKNKETVILDDFLALSLIALSYGLAHIFHAYGFLAVFAAGLSMRQISKQQDTESLQSSQQDGATMVAAVRSFTEQLERIGEVVSVVLLGMMFQPAFFEHPNLWIIPVIFLVVRPLAVVIGLLGLPMDRLQRPLISWFGIRGIGSIYYVTYVLGRGVKGDTAQQLALITYCTVVMSIFVHGLSGIPFMSLYKKHFPR